MVEQLQSIAVRQTHVGEAQIVTVLLHELRRLEFAGRAIRVESHALQSKAQQLANIGFIVDDQHSAF
jgi:hypothetical protein